MSRAGGLNILESSCFASSRPVLKQPAADLDCVADMLKHDYRNVYLFQSFSAMQVQFI